MIIRFNNSEADIKNIWSMVEAKIDSMIETG